MDLLFRAAPMCILLGIPLGSYYIVRAARQFATPVALIGAFLMSWLTALAYDARAVPAQLPIRWMSIGGGVVTGARLVEVIVYRGVLQQKGPCLIQFFAALFLLEPRPRRPSDPVVPWVSASAIPSVLGLILAIVVASHLEDQVALAPFWESPMGLATALIFSYSMGVFVMNTGRFTEHLQFRCTNKLCNTVSNEHSYADPFSAVSIQELWSHRWNGLMKDLYKRLVFQPLHGAGCSSLCAAFSSFIFSGLLHDWWNYLAFGTCFPYQSIFFWTQAGLVALEIKFLKGLGRPSERVGVAYVCSRVLTTIVLGLTGIVFMLPYAQAGLAKSVSKMLRCDVLTELVLGGEAMK